MSQHTINTLFRACEIGDLKHIVDYFKKNPNSEIVTDGNHVTPLQVAAANNQVILKSFIQVTFLEKGLS